MNKINYLAKITVKSTNGYTGKKSSVHLFIYTLFSLERLSLQMYFTDELQSNLVLTKQVNSALRVL